MLYHGLKIFLIASMLPVSLIQGTLHPTHSMEEAMTCEEFGKTARFHPYSVLDDVWFVFYTWGKTLTRRFKFYFPTTKEKNYIQNKLENATIPVNWTSRVVLMKDLHNKLTFLLVQRGEVGEFWMYHFQASNKDEMLNPEKVMLKQTCENRFIGYMNCKTEEVFAMSRITQIPRKNFLRDAAATIGYRGRGGLSYLYQGHQWMPVGEDDEEEYWLHPDEHARRAEALDRYADQHPDENAKPDFSPKPPLFPKSITIGSN